MKIANPLYDHAFKYLMSNDCLAKKVLSVILEKEVLELELQSQEVVIEDEKRRFTLYRLDFKALLLDENGRKEQVLIELQKSKLPTNILRFRNYLGTAYLQKPGLVTKGEIAKETLPIITIYILGYNVEDIPVMAVRIDNKIMDMSRHTELDIQSDFIDLLNHTSYILQVRRLPPERRSRIEQFMSLFNQTLVKETGYIINLDNIPEEFMDIAEYLQKPLMEEEVRNKLQAEEQLEPLFAAQEAETEELRKLAEEAQQQKEEALLREQEAQQQKEEERKQKEEALLREKEAQQQREEALSQARSVKLKLASLLLKSRQSREEVAQETRLSMEELKGWSDSGSVKEEV